MDTLNLEPVAPYKEVVINGKKYKRPGISPAREALARKIGVGTDDHSLPENVQYDGQRGTRENPIVIDGNKYIYGKSKRLIRLEHFDPQTMEKFVLTKESRLTDEQRKMLGEAMEQPVVYEDDCPPTTPEQLQRMKQYAIKRKTKRNYDIV